ncbi:MAG: hypothetical protein AABY22_37090 [Nanoarchaeota archaeon]
MKFIKTLFKAPDLFGDKIIEWSKLKNRDLLIFIPMFLLSWWLYSKFFMNWFDFNWRFIPVFLMGFITCLIIFKKFRD